MEIITEQMLSCDRGLFEMPAGTGKTHQIVLGIGEFLKSRKRVLVLTHTNAGVAALKNRLRRLQVDQENVFVTTLCAFAERLVLSYPKTSGFNSSMCRYAKEYYNHCICSATVLFQQDFCADLITRSFDVLIVDEYQDCNLCQHNMVKRLTEVIPKSFVFGDRLQKIFDFHDTFPDWGKEVVPFFASRETGKILPYRWKGANEALGEWLLKELRPMLLNGCRPNYFDIGEDVFKLYKYRDCNHKYQIINFVCVELGELEGSSLVIGNSSSRKRRLDLARKLSGQFTNIESIDASEIAKRLEDYDKKAQLGMHAYWLAEFAKGCFVGLSKKSFDKTVMKALKEGRSLDEYCKSRAEFAPVLKAIDMFRENPTYSAFSEVCKEIATFGQGKLYSADEWYMVTEAISMSLRENIEATTAFETVRNRSKIRQMNVGNKIGSVLLVKGLEFDNVLIANLSDLKFPNELYVALTRPRKHLGIILQGS